LSNLLVFCHTFDTLPLSMDAERSKSRLSNVINLFIRHHYGFLAPRAYSVVMFGALCCTLLAKFFHSWRTGLTDEYFSWIFADIAVLLGIEAVLAIACFCRPRKLVIRTSIGISAIVFIWSVLNAGWLIRTGSQVLPAVLLPLFRDPFSALGIIGVNLIKMPAASVILLLPSAIVIIFLFSVLARPIPPSYNHKFFISRICVSCFLVALAISGSYAVAQHHSTSIVSEDIRYNCQLMAIERLVWADSDKANKIDLDNPTRIMPAFDKIQIAFSNKKQRQNHNVVLVVLEGIQYKHTSLYDKENGLTPHLAQMAQKGVEFTSARSTVTHSTKALFAVLTGRYPSITQDIVETVPAVKPYAGLASILKHKLNYRTACFMSAKGEFECSPGLIYNLGFDKFWAREDLNDRSDFLGYLACDEFAMLKPIIEWVKTDKGPFFLTVVCSVSHDPYEVPGWFSEPAKDPTERYRQTIRYTDKFIAALDSELDKLNIADKTIFCVISDHGEAFGEHGLFAHERIAFDEAVHIPWVVRAPALVGPATIITQPVSSVDLTPTMLTLLGFDINNVGFDGMNALGTIPKTREVYFSGWMKQSPAGFVKDGRKFIYDPSTEITCAYDLTSDPMEMVRIELPRQQAQQIADKIIGWRNGSVFGPNQQQKGDKTLFDSWYCGWGKRVSWAKYHKQTIFAAEKPENKPPYR
jgi:phosphoglycerol transferase MdoB-like AlkP superfamily enzyme